MQYFISFLEGIITFISPCLLPMLPIYVSYFAGGGEESAPRTARVNATEKRAVSMRTGRAHAPPRSPFSPG